MRFSISLLFETLAFVLSIVFFILKPKNKLLLYFMPFLALTVAVEFLGWSGVFNGNNALKYTMYNIFIPIEFVFYGFLFQIHLRKPLFKKLVVFFIILFVLLTLVNFGFIQGLNKTFNSYTALLGSFFIVLFCCLYFYETISPFQMDVKLSNHPFFWIVSGLLIFYLGSVIANALYEYLKNNDLQEESRRIYVIIFASLNVILYSCFSIAFYICKNDRKISSSPS